MLLSVILAQIFGLYFVLMGIVMVVKQSRMKRMIEHLDADNDALLFNSMFSCLLGICIVVVHTYWAMNWRIVITILGWLILIKSLAWLFGPKLMTTLTKKCYLGKGYYVAIVFSIILGLFLVYHGYSFMWGTEHVIIKFN